MRAEYLLKLLEKNERVDGRRLDDFRPINIETGIIQKAEGSARVRVGKTEVIVGVKLDIGEPYLDKPNAGVLRTGAEFTPIAHGDFESGPPGEDAIELARVVDRGIRESGCIEFEKLCLKEKERVWMVSVDVHIINHDGNLIDVSSLAAVAALLNTRIPKIEKEEIVRDEFSGKLPVVDKPITITVGKILDKYILDPTQEEEGLLEHKLSIAITKDDKICAMQKSDSNGLAKKELNEMVTLAMKKSKELRKLL